MFVLGFNLAKCVMEGENNSQCLFCNFSDKTVEEVLGHVKKSHNVDIANVVKANQIDEQLDYVKLINFLRKQGVCLVIFLIFGCFFISNKQF